MWILSKNKNSIIEAKESITTNGTGIWCGKEKIGEYDSGAYRIVSDIFEAIKNGCEWYEMPND